MKTLTTRTQKPTPAGLVTRPTPTLTPTTTPGRPQGTRLTTTERDILFQCECRIADNLRAYQIVGAALDKIRADKPENGLYREKYPTFEAYCLEEWQMSVRHAYRQIEAAKVTAEVCPIGSDLPTPANERVARALDAVPSAFRQLVWAQAVGEHPRRKPTARDVVRVARQYIDWTMLSESEIDALAEAEAAEIDGRNRQDDDAAALARDGKRWRWVSRSWRDWTSRVPDDPRYARVAAAAQELADALAEVVPEDVRELPKKGGKEEAA